MEYISVKEAAQKWGVFSRRVASLCTQERIEGAMRVGNMWIIPATVGKPEDARHTNSVKYNFLLIVHEYLFVFRKG